MNTRTNDLFSLEHTIAKPLLESCAYPWEALNGLSDFIVSLGKTLPEEEYDLRGENIWVAKNAKIADTAYITGPAIICPDAEVRHCAFVRGSAIIGCGATVGNSTELKNSILFDGAQAPHYNYVGDSILGYKAHMGAGSITSNLKSDKTNIVVKDRAAGETIETGRRKMGAMLGDNAEIGCNAVMNPGTVIGRNTTVYPLTSVRGYIGENMIVKSADVIVAKK